MQHVVGSLKCVVEWTGATNTQTRSQYSWTRAAHLLRLSVLVRVDCDDENRKSSVRKMFFYFYYLVEMLRIKNTRLHCTSPRWCFDACYSTYTTQIHCTNENKMWQRKRSRHIKTFFFLHAFVNSYTKAHNDRAILPTHTHTHSSYLLFFRFFMLRFFPNSHTISRVASFIFVYFSSLPAIGAHMCSFVCHSFYFVRTLVHSHFPFPIWIANAHNNNNNNNNTITSVDSYSVFSFYPNSPSFEPFSHMVKNTLGQNDDWN